MTHLKCRSINLGTANILNRLKSSELESPDPRSDSGWHSASREASLPEAHRSIQIPQGAGFFRKMLAFAGPGYMVAVGYMDPGNWATDLEGGSKFGYTLLSVVLLSNLMAVLLQALCARLGIVTGRDLAQACRDHYSKPVAIGLWVLCEVAICACDLAEVIGSAIALKLLFKIPLTFGVCLTALDVFAVLFLQHKGFRYIEALVITLILLIGGCFAFEIFWSQPSVGGIARGFLPVPELLTNHAMLYTSIAILGATVMPHNLYLHSSIVQTRAFERTREGKGEAIRYATLDSTLALTFALFINAAILIVSAASFHSAGKTNVADIQNAYELLTPMLGATFASAAFAIALLASGQNSTLTGTLAGQIVMEGFLRIRIQPWLRRVLTRAIAIIPAVVVCILYGENGVGRLLIFSQVVLSLQLAFAVVPLVVFTGDRKKMGEFLAPGWMRVLAWITATIIIALNAKFLYDWAFDHSA